MTNFLLRDHLLILALLGFQFASAQGAPILTVDDARHMSQAVQMLVSQYG
jgi:hypothetical protein